MNPKTVRLKRAAQETHLEILLRQPEGVEPEDQELFDQILLVDWLVKKRSLTSLTEKDIKKLCTEYLQKYAPEKL